MDFESNPYDPPRAPIGIQPRVPFGANDEFQVLEIAGKWRRVGTLLIDYIGFFCLSFALGFAVALIGGQEGIDRLQQVPDFLLGVFIMTFYYAFFEGIWGRTPGKLVCGTKVVDENGGQPSFGQILGRTLCHYIPFEAFSFLGSRGWHDSISKTSVVMAR